MSRHPDALARHAAIAIAVAHLIAGLFLLAPAYIRPDSVGVAAWLRSLVFDGDLLFFNEWRRFGMIVDGIPFFKEVAPTGALANHWPIGTSLLVAPPYAVVTLLSRLGLVGAADGGFFGVFAATFAWAIVASVAAAHWFGFRLICRLAEIQVPAALLALALVWVGTPLAWYELRFPIGSHGAGAFFVALLLWVLMRLEREPEQRAWALLLGLAFGLAVVTRLQHVVLAPAVALFLLHARMSLRVWLLASAGGVLPLAVQSLAWQAIYGSPLGPLVSGVALGGATYLPFVRFALFDVLFSSYHGLLSWSPVVVLAVGGWFVALRRGSVRWPLTLIVMFVAELVANATLDRYFWGGLSFGGRRFADLAIPFSIGLAWLFTMRRRAAAITLAVVASAWGAALAAAAVAGRLDLVGDVGYGDLVAAIAATVREGARSPLFSPVTYPPLLLQSVVAVAVIAVLAALAALVVRSAQRAFGGVAAYLVFWLLSVGVAFLPTRIDAETEARAAGVVPSKGLLGPLLDQQQLLMHELRYLQRRGRDDAAQRTAAELETVRAAIERMQRE